jgi:hypothetical protein
VLRLHVAPCVVLNSKQRCMPTCENGVMVF